METPDSPQPVRAAPIAIAITLFISFFTLIPFGWMFLMVPVTLEPAGEWAYALGVVALSTRIALIGQRPSARRSVGLAVAIALLSVVLFVAFLGDGFTITDRVAEVTSPNGKLVLVHEYFDQGALGGDNLVYVHGRLVPGVISWRYDVPMDEGEYPRELSWSGSSAVSVNHQRFTVPRLMAWLSW